MGMKVRLPARNSSLSTSDTRDAASLRGAAFAPDFYCQLKHSTAQQQCARLLQWNHKEAEKERH